MKLGPAFLAVGALALCGLVALYFYEGSSSVGQQSSSCRQKLSTFEAATFASTVSVVYDFSAISPEQLQRDVDALYQNLNQKLVRELVLVQNRCDDAGTREKAVQIAGSREKIKLIIVDSGGELVCAGRARDEAVKELSAPFLLFLQAGHTPAEPDFLEHLLLDLTETPAAALVPHYQTASEDTPHLTINLGIKPAKLSSPASGLPELPLINPQAFIIRRDLYQAVGGFDPFFFKNDHSDAIALSLSLWLCGGSVRRSACAAVSGTQAFAGELDSKAVRYLQHAKYIQSVYLSDLRSSVQYPGLEYYHTPATDLEPARSRRKLLSDRGCISARWYAKRFPAYFTVKDHGRFYDPNYNSPLPEYKPFSPTVGKWFALYAGHCLFVNKENEDIIGLVWCPTTISDSSYKFLWVGEGTLKSDDRCVSLDSDANILRLKDCVAGDVNQRFTYDKATRKITSGVDASQCITHMSNEKYGQVLGIMSCKDNEPFNLFVFNDEY